MRTLNLHAIPVRETLTAAEFQTEFVKPNKPVVMKSYSQNWPALTKWTYDYFKQHCGDVMVPLYAEAMADKESNYMASDNKMRFADYLDLLKKGPTLQRMFLFNIFKHMPQLCQDFSYTPIINRYVTKYPFMFFGGETSYVDIHYDVDLSHVILTQFGGTKKIILFAPEYSTHLYRHPLTVSCNIDFRNPDFEKYPLLEKIQGYECTLNHGDTLFIPSGYWHYIYYETQGFSLSLRARPGSVWRRLYSGIKIFNLTVLDRLIAKYLGAKKWYDIKERMAHKRAEQLIHG
jgi:hypothetical protein